METLGGVSGLGFKATSALLTLVWPPGLWFRVWGNLKPKIQTLNPKPCMGRKTTTTLLAISGTSRGFRTTSAWPRWRGLGFRGFGLGVYGLGIRV